MSFQDIIIPELINHIGLKCDVETMCNLRLTSKEIKNIIDIKTIKIINMKKIIPQILHKYINFNSTFMLNSQHIDLGEKFGITGYIDFIEISYFINANYNTNIIYGYDNISRFFISILYIDQLTNKTKIVTFFQRYTSDSRYYVSSQSTFIYSSYCATFCFTNDFKNKLTEIYEILFKLINEGIAESNIDSDEKYSYKLDIS